jgi:hypothetical protein
MVHVLRFSPHEYQWDRVPHSREAYAKQGKGIPLQQSDIPVEARLAGPFKMPDVGVPTEGFFFASDRGRAGIEELAPGCCAFFAVKLQAPESMQLEKRYWFVEVTARAQSIDWDRSETKQRTLPAPDGRPCRVLERGGVFGTSAKFKAMTPDIPPLWREADLDRPSIKYFHPKLDILMRDEFWEALNARFPGQLTAYKITERDG